MTETLGPDLELQKAVVAKLDGDAEIKALIGNPARIYQKVPANAKFPYIVIGDSQRVDDHVQFLASEEIYISLHIWNNWSNTEALVTSKRIESRSKNLIHDANLSLSQNRCVLIHFDSARDGAAESPALCHRIVSFRALTDPA